MRWLPIIGLASVGLSGCTWYEFDKLCRELVPEEPITPIDVEGIQLQGFPYFLTLQWKHYALYADFVYPDPHGEKLGDLRGASFLEPGLYRIERVDHRSDACRFSLTVEWGAETGQELFESVRDAPGFCMGLSQVDRLTSQYVVRHDDDPEFASFFGRDVRRVQTVLIDKRDNSEIGRLIHLSVRNELPNIMYVPDMHTCGNVYNAGAARNISEFFNPR